MEHWERHKRVWRFFNVLLGGWLKRKFNYSPELAGVEGPFLLLANHATDWDPLLVALSFPKTQMYFVASEHIFRWGLTWRLIDWLLHPISRLKGSTAADTVMTVMRRMKKGANVAIFAEGNRTWDGKTGYILPSTGKLARSCGGALVTYRLTGGYFTSPRWSGKSLRRGKMTGGVVGVYSREELRAMTPEEINEIINRDLFEDAYARQRTEMVPYKGKAPAEGLETMLCLCPKCRSLGALRSRDDKLICDSCGLSLTYDEYGFLRGETPFDNVADFDAWQTGVLRELAEEAGDGPLFSDEGAALRRILKGHGSEELGAGKLELWRDRLVCAGHEFPLAEISGIGMHGPLRLDFSLGGDSYELAGAERSCVRKYMTTYNILTGKGN